jgi:predicted porin
MNPVSAVHLLKCSAVAIALLTALAKPAWAQWHGVSVYGRVVAGVDYQNNVATGENSSGNLLRGASNQWGTSMVGLRGYSDIDGSLNVFFLLESGFDAAKGTTSGSALFNRRAYVGLNGDAGSIKFGKNLSVSNDVYYIDPTGQQFIGSATLVRGRNWLGADNVIEYETPNLGGLTIRMQTGLGEIPGSLTAGRKDGISVAYATPLFEVHGIYDVIRDQTGQYSSLFLNSREFIVGGMLKSGNLKLFAGYENLQAPDATTGTPDKAHHYWLGLNYGLTPALTLIGAAFRINVNNAGGSANLFMLGANYSLSKRTLLYASVGTVRNGSNANFSVETTDNRPLPGQSQLGAYVGIAHVF